mgnify:CR=1 FL=1
MIICFDNLWIIFSCSKYDFILCKISNYSFGDPFTKSYIVKLVYPNLNEPVDISGKILSDIFKNI